MDGTAAAKASASASASATAPELEGGARAVGDEGITIIDFGAGKALIVCGTDGAARRDGGVRDEAAAGRGRAGEGRRCRDEGLGRRADRVRNMRPA